MCNLFLAYNQVWLNLPRHNRHFSYKQKFLIKNTLPRRHYVCSIGFQNLVSRDSGDLSLTPYLHICTGNSAKERQFDNRDSALLCLEAIVWAKE
jgi:hypothetical protein